MREYLKCFCWNLHVKKISNAEKTHSLMRIDHRTKTTWEMNRTINKKYVLGFVLKFCHSEKQSAPDNHLSKAVTSEKEWIQRENENTTIIWRAIQHTKIWGRALRWTWADWSPKNITHPCFLFPNFDSRAPNFYLER